MSVLNENIKGITKRFKSPIVNPETGEIELRDINMSNMSQDIWIPTPILSDTEELDKLNGITKNNENTKKISVFDKPTKLIKK